MININMTGDELIAQECERRVDEENYSTIGNAKRFPNGELVEIAAAILYGNPHVAPKGYDILVANIMELPRVEQLVQMGAFVAEEIDRLNLITELSQSLPNVQDSKKTVPNKILPPDA